MPSSACSSPAPEIASPVTNGQRHRCHSAVRCETAELVSVTPQPRHQTRSHVSSDPSDEHPHVRRADPRGRGDEAPIEIGGARGAGEGKGEVELGQQDLDDPLRAIGTVERKSPHERPSDHHGARPERERLEHVRAAPDPAVDDHVEGVANGIDHAGQGIRPREHGVELAAAVVGHDHAARAVLRRQPGVLGGQDPLDDYRQSAVRRELFDVGPPQVGVEQAGDPGRGERGGRLDRAFGAEGVGARDRVRARRANSRSGCRAPASPAPADRRSRRGPHSRARPRGRSAPGSPRGPRTRIAETIGDSLAPPPRAPWRWSCRASRGT